MPRVVRRPRADADLYDCGRYIARDNLDAADRFVDRINATCTRLAERPLIGRARSDIVPELRSFAVGSYAIYYFPLRDGIEMVRVLHSARNIDATMFDH